MAASSVSRAIGKPSARISKKLHTHSLHSVRMGGVFFIDEVNSKRGASVMGKRACPQLSAWVFLLLRKLGGETPKFLKEYAYIFLMGLSGGQNKAILMQ